MILRIPCLKRIGTTEDDSTWFTLGEGGCRLAYQYILRVVGITDHA